jgi:hypothetical protein
MLFLSNKYLEVFSFLNLVAADLRAVADPAKRNQLPTVNGRSEIGHYLKNSPRLVLENL